MPRARKKVNSFKDSPFIKLTKEINQDPSLRLRLIRKLETEFGGKVVTMFAGFSNQNSMVSDDDAEMLESILSVEHTIGDKLFLVVNSPGGSGMAAERIVNTCRAYSGDKFEVIVPHMAKSAATMICFGASVIHMSPTAELGPVDPQVPYFSPGLLSDAQQTVPIWTSAEEYVRSYDTLLEKASNGAAPRIEPFLQQLNRYDARFIEQLRSSQDLAKDISVRLLASGMLAGTSPADIHDKIQIFLTQTGKGAHGRMINATEAKSCGLTIVDIDLQSDVWHTLWALYVRSNWTVSNRCTKVIESSKSSVFV